MLLGRYAREADGSMNLSRRPKLTPSAHIEETPGGIGLRLLAVFEASKGLLVLLVALGLSSMAHRRITPLEVLLDHEGWLTHHHLSGVIIRAVSHLNDSTLVLLAWAALAYAAVRFIEAYGLWHRRRWAEWFALLSTAMYLPWEIVEVIRRPSPVKYGLAAISLAVCFYLGWRRYRAR